MLAGKGKEVIVPLHVGVFALPDSTEARDGLQMGVPIWAMTMPRPMSAGSTGIVAALPFSWA
ncbi:hypothetical protein D3C83_314800 [compost metagenome]